MKDDAPAHPEGTTPPDSLPPSLRPPDIVDPQKLGPTYTAQQKAESGKKKDGKRSHPTDAYQPLKKKKGCCGCSGCLGAGVLLAAFATILLGIWATQAGPLKYVTKESYEVVTFSTSPVTITEEPENPTFYFGQTINYEVPVTKVPVAIVGSELNIEGDFWKDLSVTGLKVTLTQQTRVAGNLETFVVDLHDHLSELRGERKGRVLKHIKE